MTRYAIDGERGALMAVWASGAGDLAATVATLPEGCKVDDARTVAYSMTRLAQSLWRTYTHPAGAAGGLEEGGEGWRRQQERDAFAEVVSAIRSPNLPEGGVLVQSRIPVTEYAHRVGRVLYAVGDAGLTEAVAREVEGELAAVESAELGDLSGRAVQAVVLTREDVSPVQVAAADRILREDPFGDERLFTQVDPAAAAVAAAHWLQAAADVAARVSDADAAYVVAEADDIEALPHQTPTLVLELMADGATPREVVTALIRDAMLVAEGVVPNPEGLAQAVADAAVQAERLRQEEGLSDVVLAGIRATALDPARPAPDLLEDLLAGIHGCWLVYGEYAADAGLNASGRGDAVGDGERAEGGGATRGSAGDGGAGDGGADDYGASGHRADRDDESDEADSAAFLDLVRAQAAADAERLT